MNLASRRFAGEIFGGLCSSSPRAPQCRAAIRVTKRLRLRCAPGPPPTQPRGRINERGASRMLPRRFFHARLFEFVLLQPLVLLRWLGRFFLPLVFPRVFQPRCQRAQVILQRFRAVLPGVTNTHISSPTRGVMPYSRVGSKFCVSSSGRSNSSVPKVLGSMDCHASSRTVGLASFGPTPSRQW